MKTGVECFCAGVELGVMTTPIRTEVHVGDPAGCPVAAASDHADGGVSAVRRTGLTPGGGFVEEFSVATPIPSEIEPAPPFETTEGETTYRYEKSVTDRCVCGLVEGHDLPMRSVRAADGTLVVEFSAPDLATVREVVAELSEAFDEVSVARLVRPGKDDGRSGDARNGGGPRARLTDRQHEVLRTAYEMGYFEYPRESNATAVAEALDIAPSTFREHLAAAQGHVLDDRFEY